MDRNKMLQVLAPAGAVAGVVVLIGVLIGLSDWGTPAAGPGKDGAAGLSVPAAGDASGMSESLPPVDAPDWKPAAGGMKVWDVKEGEGDPCRPGANVTIHYTGWTLAGTVFDSSVRKGQPANFGLDGLIKGWQEGIPGMKPGGIRRLYIPSAWAYGKRGSPPAIPPDADLVFEVKLLGAR